MSPVAKYWDGAAWQDIAFASAPSGPAGGALSGTYPNPALADGAATLAKSDHNGIHVDGPTSAVVTQFNTTPVTIMTTSPWTCPRTGYYHLVCQCLFAPVAAVNGSQTRADLMVDLNGALDADGRDGRQVCDRRESYAGAETDWATIGIDSWLRLTGAVTYTFRMRAQLIVNNSNWQAYWHQRYGWFYLD